MGTNSILKEFGYYLKETDIFDPDFKINDKASRFLERLKVKERISLELAAKGCSYPEISKKTGLDTGRVEGVLKNLYLLFYGRDFPKGRYRLKAIRRSLEVGQDEVAKVIGKTKDAYSKYERGAINFEGNDIEDRIGSFLLSKVSKPEEISNSLSTTSKEEVWEVLVHPVSFNQPDIAKKILGLKDSKLKHIFFYLLNNYGLNPLFFERYFSLFLKLHKTTPFPVNSKTTLLNLKDGTGGSYKAVKLDLFVRKIISFSKKKNILLDKKFVAIAKEYLKLSGLRESYLETISFVKDILLKEKTIDKKTIMEVFFGIPVFNKKILGVINDVVDKYFKKYS